MGNIIAKIAPNSLVSVNLPPSSKFDPTEDIPDLSGKVVIVTGGSKGIGYQTVKYLLLKNAKVYIAARTTTAKEEDLAKRLKDETGREPVFLNLDLADLRRVRTAADEFLASEDRLDVLFNNAGIMVPPTDMLTEQGYDIRTNVLGHYFFTKLLLPALKRSAEHNGTKARVVNVSSAGSLQAPGATGIDWSTLKGGAARDDTLKRWWSPLRPWRLYGASKLGNILMANFLARRHGDIIMSCSVNPGNIRTTLQDNMPPYQRFLIDWLLYPAHYGAWTQLWAGTSPEGEGLSGKYLVPWARIGKVDTRAKNEKTQDELEKWLEEQIQGF